MRPPALTPRRIDPRIDLPTLPPDGRRRRLFRVAAVVAAAAVAASVLWVAGGEQGGGRGSDEGDSSLPPSSSPVATVAATLPVADLAAALMVDGTDLWVRLETPAVSRIDMVTGEVLTTLQLPVTPDPSYDLSWFLGVGDGNVWVSDYGADRLSRLDPATGAAAVSLEAPEGQALYPLVLGYGAGALYQAGGQLVTRRDPVTLVETATTAGGLWAVDQLTVDGDRLWFLASDGEGVSQLVSVDRVTLEERLRTPVPQAASLAFGAGSVWVSSRDGSVRRVDPVSGVVTEHLTRIGAAESRIEVAFGADRLWVATGNGLSSIDPATSEVSQVFTVAGVAGDVAASGDTVWLADPALGVVWRHEATP